MARKLSTLGWILHDLGLASLFGGSLFGRLALNRAVSVLDSKAERGRVVNAAWNGYNIINALGLGTATVTWLIGRTMLSGREVDQETHALVVAKDALIAGAVGTGILSAVCAAALAKQGPGGAVPLESGNAPAAETPPRAQQLLRFINILGPVNIALTAGVLGITTVLAMKSSKSHRFAAISSLLP
jgi:hypothetical protein